VPNVRWGSTRLLCYGIEGIGLQITIFLGLWRRLEFYPKYVPQEGSIEANPSASLSNFYTRIKNTSYSEDFVLWCM